MVNQISRSKSWITVPDNKKDYLMRQVILDCEECQQNKVTELNAACPKCNVLITAYRRYADSNIPIRYWKLSMKDFKGDKSLLKVYEDVTGDLNKSYNEGICICLAGGHGIGKQIDLDTEIPTVNGFIKLVDLKVGDKIFDENGNACNVIKLHPIDLQPKSYKVIFDDGSEVNACADHLWLTHTRQSRLAEQMVKSGKRKFTNMGPTVRTTEEIYQTLRVGGKQGIANHSVVCSKPINYPEKELLIDPYVLGCWLGDGFSYTGNIESADKEILMELEKAGYPCVKSNYKKYSKSSAYRVGNLILKNGLKDNLIQLYSKNLKEITAKELSEILNVCYGTVLRWRRKYFINSVKKNKNWFIPIKDIKNSWSYIRKNFEIGRLNKELRELNLIKNKHIPEDYLLGSFEQRLALLQGLLDTDGTCSRGGAVEISSSFPKLAKGIHQLILSLGIKCKIKVNKSTYKYKGIKKQGKPRYRMNFTTQLPVFRVKYKADNIRLTKSQINRTTHRFITNVIPIDSKPMRCITVDSPSNLFLVTRQFIPTHNTMVQCSVLKRAAAKGFTCLYVTLSDIVANFTTGPIEERHTARQELLTVDYLVIDEFDPRYMPTGASSDLFGRTLEDVVRKRTENLLPLLMSTNSPNVIDSFQGSMRASIESLMNYMTIIPVLGIDHRKGAK